MKKKKETTSPTNRDHVAHYDSNDTYAHDKYEVTRHADEDKEHEQIKHTQAKNARDTHATDENKNLNQSDQHRENLIEAKNISKIYGKGNDTTVNALDNVSLKIERGAFIAIMGASGSGKSTLMNILGCLDRATRGSVFLDGHEVNALNDEELAAIRNKKIGFVFQSFNLLARTSALENVELPLLYSDRSHITELAREALTSVGLSDRMHHLPNELSGGQQQRVAIARALVNDPEIIFADEPTGNLDSQSSLEIMSLLQKLHNEGRTIVLVTHEEDITRFAGRIIQVADGKIVRDNMNSEPVQPETGGNK